MPFHINRQTKVLNLPDITGVKCSGSMTYDLSLGPGATAVGGSQGGGARLGVPRDVTVLRGTTDGQRVDTVGVAVTVTAVLIPTPVP